MSSLDDLRHLVILKKSVLDALQREYDRCEALEEECDKKQRLQTGSYRSSGDSYQRCEKLLGGVTSY